jgi:anti-anti-sigma factor
MTVTLGAEPTPVSPQPFLLSIDIPAARIRVRGELDRRHVHRLDEAVAVLTHSASPSWSVDVSDLTFCDAAGLRALLRARRLAEHTGRGFDVVGPSPCLRRLLGLVGVDVPCG